MILAVLLAWVELADLVVPDIPELLAGRAVQGYHVPLAPPLALVVLVLLLALVVQHNRANPADLVDLEDLATLAVPDVRDVRASDSFSVAFRHSR